MGIRVNGAGVGLCSAGNVEYAVVNACTSNTKRVACWLCDCPFDRDGYFQIHVHTRKKSAIFQTVSVQQISKTMARYAGGIVLCAHLINSCWVFTRTVPSLFEFAWKTEKWISADLTRFFASFFSTLHVGDVSGRGSIERGDGD